MLTCIFHRRNILPFFDTLKQIIISDIIWTRDESVFFP